jgi:transcriptional regulator with XRE-family HTH domain
MLDIILQTPYDMRLMIAKRFKEKRLILNLTQKVIAERSGLSLASVKRFEATGLISFKGLLDMALILRCLKDFDNICQISDLPASLFGPRPKKRLRGRKK